MLALVVLVTLIATDPRVEALWHGGRRYEVFHEDAKARRTLWDRNTERATVPEELLLRARSAGAWRVLAVAVDRCSDSASTIPYVAALAAAADNIELRIVTPADARWIMEQHRTSDGRAATPTLVLLDERFEIVGAWVERPRELQDWVSANRGRLADRELLDYELDWYERDEGRSTLREIVELMERSRR